MISTIIFDLGNVVLSNDWHDGNVQKFAAYAQAFGTDYGAMEKGWQAAWPKFSIGQISEDEFWRIFLGESKARAMDLVKAKELWRRYQTSDPEMFALLSRLKARYKLGALTTISKEWLDFKRDKFRLDDYFQVILASGYIGKQKPEKEAFQAIWTQLDTLPEQSLFIDDAEMNIRAANALGMETIQFQRRQQLIGELSKIGIEV